MSENAETPFEEEKDGENPKNLEKLKRYETTIRRRVEFEERAFHIVNKLIYGSVEPDYLIECGKFITKDNYGDIVEERAISSLCGYPLCEKELRNIPKQKYFISTKSNKVYDITERKNFCSNQCLKASKAFQIQIPDSPVWTRDQEPATVITLLPNKSTKGIIGTEVVGEPPWKFLQGEIDSLKELDSKKATASGSRGTLRNAKKDTDYAKSVDDQSHSSKVKTPHRSRKESPSRSSDSGNMDVGSNLERLKIEETPSNLSDNAGSEVQEDSKLCADKLELCEKMEEQRSINENSAAREMRKGSEGNQMINKTKTNVSPLDRLNFLLAKKKDVLSQMVEIQDTATTKTTSKNSPKPSISEEKGEFYSPSSTDKSKIILSDALENISHSPRSSGCEEQTLSISSRENENSDTKKSPDDETVKHRIVLSPLQQICRLIQSWVTENTKQYLMASETSEATDMNTTAFSDPKIQRGYADLCKRLDLQEQGVKDTFDELTDEKKKDNSSRLQSIPDYKLLKEESEQFQLKVTEFITGKKVKDPKHSKAEKTSEDDNPVYLPTVDIYDQMMIRAKIVLDRLDKTIPELLVPMDLTVQDVSTSLRELIYTFRLERDNIIFKPFEWTLVALILLQMLARKVQVIESAFRKDTAINYLNILLREIGQTSEDLLIVVDSLLK